ncbi:MAG: hypothetical protein AAGD06_11870 [Acidobacteriota bacterium]
MRVASLVLLAACLLLAGTAQADPINRSDSDFSGKPAGPDSPVGSNTCPPTAAVSGPLPYNDTGDTCGNTNDIGAYPGGSCGTDLPFAYDGEDVIYEVPLGAGNNVTFSADLTGSTGDLALFLLSTCGDGNTCVAHSQDAIGAGNGPELIDPANYPDGTYYLYIDSYYAAGNAGSCGTYALEVTGTLPVELLEFSID